MVKKRNKIVRNILVESLSEDHVRVIESLYEPRYDEEVADELNIKATVIRTILNDLHSASLVEYDRSKNKKTGWYTYVWKRRDDKVSEYINKYLQEKLIKLTSDLESEKHGTKFKCKCSVLPFESAMDMNFVCPECGESMVEHDNSAMIDELVGKISTIKGLIEQT